MQSSVLLRYSRKGAWRGGSTMIWRVYYVCGIVAILYQTECKVLNSCRVTDWSDTKEDVPCNSTEAEVYYETVGRLTSRFCCNNGPNRDLEEERKIATSCKIVACQDVGTNPRAHDMCAGLPQRFIRENRSHRELTYQEELRESCQLRKSKTGTGATAVCCPKRSHTGTRIALHSAEPYEFPYIAHVFNQETGVVCGGAIYNDLFIITAAHCVVNRILGKPTPPDFLDVLLGTNIALLENRHFRAGYYEVEDNYPDPSYSGFKYSTDDDSCHFNDFAVLKLKKRIVFTENVKAIRIAPQEFRPEEFGTYAISAGWGIDTQSKYLPYLRKVDMKLRSDQMCFEGVGATYPWEASCGGVKNRSSQFLCLGGLAQGEDGPDETQNPKALPEGNSGSPVVCRDENGDSVLCGIVSSGGHYTECYKFRNEEHCRFIRASEISYFRRFIQDKAGDQNPEEFFQLKAYGTKSLDPNEFPHQVFITSNHPRVRPCGGTLVSRDTIVTAAHCVSFRSRIAPWISMPLRPNAVTVLARFKDLRQLQNRSNVHSIKAIHIVPQFRPAPIQMLIIKALWYESLKYNFTVPIEDLFYFNDLAVLKLERPVNIGKTEVALLPKTEDGVTLPPGISATAIGVARNNTKGPGKLLHHDVTVLNLAECRERLRRAHVSQTSDNIICGVEKHSGGSLCNREVGGGIVRKVLKPGGTYRDVLIAVQALRLCELSLPNIYTNVALYTEWIQDIAQRK